MKQSQTGTNDLLYRIDHGRRILWGTTLFGSRPRLSSNDRLHATLNSVLMWMMLISAAIPLRKSRLYWRPRAMASSRLMWSVSFVVAVRRAAQIGIRVLGGAGPGIRRARGRIDRSRGVDGPESKTVARSPRLLRKSGVLFRGNTSSCIRLLLLG